MGLHNFWNLLALEGIHFIYTVDRKNQKFKFRPVSPDLKNFEPKAA